MNKGVSRAAVSLSGLLWELADVCLGVAGVQGGMQVCTRTLQMCVREGVMGSCVTEPVMQECRAGRSVPQGHRQQGGPGCAVGCVWQRTQVFGNHRYSGETTGWQTAVFLRPTSIHSFNMYKLST